MLCAYFFFGIFFVHFSLFFSLFYCDTTKLNHMARSSEELLRLAAKDLTVGDIEIEGKTKVRANLSRTQTGPPSGAGLVDWEA